MKIFTYVDTQHGEKAVSSLLVNDKNNQYMAKTIRLETKDTLEAHLWGIKRALSFVKSNNLLYCNEPCEIVGNYSNEDIIKLNEKISKDEYCNNFIKTKGIPIINVRKPNDDERNHYIYVQSQIGVLARYSKECRGL